MKKMAIVLLTLGLGFGACNNEKKGELATDNPFFSEYQTPFGVPPFEEIKPEHYIPAFEKGMQEQLEEVEEILNNKEEPTFDNTFAALDRSGKLLGKVSTVFFSQSGANTNEDLQKIQMEISPKLSAHGDKISLNPKLFERIKKVYQNRDEFDLTAEESFLLENMYKNLVRGGADLPDEKKSRLMEINQKMSTLGVQFDQNVLAETNEFKLVIENEEDLAGLPESVIAGAADAAREADLEGKWVFTTQRPSMYPFLQYSEKRDLREKLHKAYLNRGNHDDDRDNKSILAEMLKLRVEKAQLLGYDNHASLRLESRMAETPEKAIELLMQLWNAAIPVAKNEAKQMQDMIDAEGGTFKLASWDWWHYAEKIRMAKYQLDEKEVRPYFKLDNVREGAFAVANKLYGISFTEIEDIPRPHPDAKAFEVKEEDGSHLGVLYMDFHPRASKQGGAWCGGYRDRHIEDGKVINPVVTVVCNFTKPVGDQPALISVTEAHTLFHEFGHALDGLFSETSYQSSYIAWDFVELPSQIMEHWVMENDVLNMYAKHYETGEVIPEELVKKLDAASKFNQGFETVEYLAASLLDLKYHTLEEPKMLDISSFEKDYLNGIGLIPQIEPRYRSTYFGHIIGGYDAGYYSYIWAGVLDCDAYQAFKEHGIFDRETANKFRYEVLAKNGIENAMKMFVNFRGREPIIEPLLEARGLN